MKIEVGEHALDCSERPAIMGILNLGTDSPVAHSVVPSNTAPNVAAERAETLREAGAAIIDVGAHSTRTGGEAPTPEQEIERLCPAIEALRHEGHLISVDTWTAAVADAALHSGAQILNDVTAAADPGMADVAARHGCPLIVMHMRGRPKAHRAVDQAYDDVAKEVRDYLVHRADALSREGVDDIWIDPGFEFAKSLDDNLRMLASIPQLIALGRPGVISASRKGFLAEVLGHGKLRSSEAQQVPGILPATIAVNAIAGLLGVQIVRVHDVAETRQALDVWEAIGARHGGAEL